MSLTEKYPEHAKLFRQQARFDELVKFMEWVLGQGEVLVVDRSDRWEYGYESTPYNNSREWACAYLGIDEAKLRKEEAQMREDMLARLQSEMGGQGDA